MRCSLSCASGSSLWSQAAAPMDRSAIRSDTVQRRCAIRGSSKSVALCYLAVAPVLPGDTLDKWARRKQHLCGRTLRN